MVFFSILGRFGRRDAVDGHEAVARLLPSGALGAQCVLKILSWMQHATRHHAAPFIAYGDDDSFKLFDIAADPKEKRDLTSKDKELFEKMRKRYEDVSRTIKERCPKMRKKLRGKKRGRPC